MTRNLQTAKRSGWLEIRRGEGGAGAEATVDCPLKGPCSPSVCLECADLRALGLDPATDARFVGCGPAMAGAAPVERLSRDEVTEPNGAQLRVFANAQQQGSGKWEGWIEFVEPAAPSSRRVVFDASEERHAGVVDWAARLSRWSGRELLIARELAARDDLAMRSDFAEAAKSAPPPRAAVLDDDAIALLDERITAYRALAQLLGHPMTEARLAEAHTMLASLDPSAFDPTGAFHALSLALAATSASAIADELGATFRARSPACLEPYSHVRQWACVAAELAPDGSCATDLAVLSALSERVVWAQRLSGDRNLARAIATSRGRFLEEHAARCTASLARILLFAHTPLMTRLGAALMALIDSETREQPIALGAA